jgi:sigma-B regulation protein RsbU (phosphoserine phosphatase)
MENARYASAVVDFGDGDSMLVVTDGFTEAADPAGQLFGDERIERHMAGAGPVMAGCLPALVREVRAFEAGLPASDDMAAILLEVGHAS